MDLSSIRDLYVSAGPWISAYLHADDDSATIDEKTVGERLATVESGLGATGDQPSHVQVDQERLAWAASLAGDARADEDVAAVALFLPEAGAPRGATLADPVREEVVTAGALPLATPLLDAAASTADHSVIRPPESPSDDATVAIFRSTGEADEHVLTHWDDPVVRRRELRELLDGGEPIDLHVLIGDTRGRSDAEVAIGDGPNVEFFHVDPERDPDLTDDGDLADAIVRRAANVAAERQVRALRRFEAARARGGAADGPADTLVALRDGTAEIVLWHDDPNDERTAWFGPEPNQVGVDEESLRRRDVAEPALGRLGDVVARAALAGHVVYVPIPEHGPATPTDGIGAVLG